MRNWAGRAAPTADTGRDLRFHVGARLPLSPAGTALLPRQSLVFGINSGPRRSILEISTGNKCETCGGRMQPRGIEHEVNTWWMQRASYATMKS